MKGTDSLVDVGEDGMTVIKIDHKEAERQSVG
jgi:hypothetical protein